MDQKETTCEGCDEVKIVPMIHIRDEIYWDGLCADCVNKYGMQTGDTVYLTKPAESHPDESRAQFVRPEENAIRISFFSDGTTGLVPWSDFRLTSPSE